MRVAIQGTHGAFSEAAARRRWPDLEAIPCREVKDVVAAVRDGRAEAGCLPIENSLIGSAEDCRERLRKLAPGRPSAEDRKLARLLSEIEYRFIREERRLGKTRNRRHHRPAAACDYGLPKTKLGFRAALTQNNHRAMTGERRRSEEHIHAQRCEPLCRIGRCEIGPLPCRKRHRCTDRNPASESSSSRKL